MHILLRSMVANDRPMVAEAENEIIGRAALSPGSGRCVYAGVAEGSVYGSAKFRRQQIGITLLQQLITESERQNIWTLQAGIFPENKASLKIHQQLNFRLSRQNKKPKEVAPWGAFKY